MEEWHYVLQVQGICLHITHTSQCYPPSRWDASFECEEFWRVPTDPSESERPHTYHDHHQHTASNV